jgi:hypothetical protein
MRVVPGLDRAGLVPLDQLLCDVGPARRCLSDEIERLRRDIEPTHPAFH